MVGFVASVALGIGARALTTGAARRLALVAAQAIARTTVRKGGGFSAAAARRTIGTPVMNVVAKTLAKTQVIAALRSTTKFEKIVLAGGVGLPGLFLLAGVADATKDKLQAALGIPSF